MSRCTCDCAHPPDGGGAPTAVTNTYHYDAPTAAHCSVLQCQARYSQCPDTGEHNDLGRVVVNFHDCVCACRSAASGNALVSQTHARVLAQLPPALASQLTNTPRPTACFRCRASTLSRRTGRGRSSARKMPARKSSRRSAPVGLARWRRCTLPTSRWRTPFWVRHLCRVQ